MRPNILLITSDQHNAQIMGCAGNPVVRTPHLDRLAREGAIFDAAYTPHPVCTPARTSILTGQYARHHGVAGNLNIYPTNAAPPRPARPQKILPATATAFPEVLARAGYHTSLFGKLHTEQEGDKNFGFQLMRLAEGKGQFIRAGAPPDDYRQYLKRKGYPDDAWRTWEIPSYPRDGRVTSPLPEEDYIDVWTATEAIEHIDKVDGPFFAWVSFSGPHTPWDPPKPYDIMYDPAAIPFPARRVGELEEKNPAWVDNIARTIPAIPWTSQDRDAPGGLERAYSHFSDDKIRSMLAAYYGEISLIDAQVGRLLAALERRGLRENTLIVFSADHGDYLGNNWAFFKYGAPYDSLARVPLIVNWPGHVAAGERRGELVSLIDLAPTFLEAAGVAPVDPFDGDALQPLLGGRAAKWREDLFIQTGAVRGLVTAEWKYIRWDAGFEELYNRRDDPHDLRNLAQQPQHAATLRDLRERLSR